MMAEMTLREGLLQHKADIEELKAENLRLCSEVRDAYLCGFNAGWNYHEHEDYNPEQAVKCWEKYDRVSTLQEPRRPLKGHTFGCSYWSGRKCDCA